MNLLRRILCPAGVVCSVAALAAPINLNHPTAFSYTQNFDTLANTGTVNAWTDDATVAGWYAQNSGTSFGDYSAGTGSSPNGDLYSYGAVASTERALGSLASDSRGHFAYGVLLHNTSGSTISELSVSYLGEQWRDGGNDPAVAQTLRFSYQISGSPSSNLTPGSDSSWTPVPTLDFISTTFTTTDGPLDGNASVNSSALSFLLSGFALNDGGYMMLRWRDLNDAPSDHGLSIDNFTVAVPEAGTIGAAALVAALAGGAWWQRQRKASRG